MTSPCKYQIEYVWIYHFQNCLDLVSEFVVYGLTALINIIDGFNSRFITLYMYNILYFIYLVIIHPISFKYVIL